MRFVTLALLIGCGGEQPPPEPVRFQLTLTNISTPGSLVPSDGVAQDHLFAPGVFILHQPGWSLFTEGAALSYDALESLAEDGDNTGIVAALEGEEGVIRVDTFAALDDNYADAPMLPGDSATISFDAVPGTQLSVATMYGESNDIFAATPASGVAVFDADDLPISGELSAELSLWDAGTERNQEPGAGSDQAPRQQSPGQGAAEGGVVQGLDGSDVEGFDYPSARELLSLELTAP